MTQSAKFNFYVLVATNHQCVVTAGMYAVMNRWTGGEVDSPQRQRTEGKIQSRLNWGGKSEIDRLLGQFYGRFLQHGSVPRRD